jgi:hypothetical protein
MTVHYVDGYVLRFRASVAGFVSDLERHGNRHGQTAIRHFGFSTKTAGIPLPSINR